MAHTFMANSNDYKEEGLRVERHLLKNSGEVLESLFPEISNTKYLAEESKGHPADALVLYHNNITYLDVKYTTWSFNAYCREVSNHRHVPTFLITTKCYKMLKQYKGSLLCINFEPDMLLMIVELDQTFEFEVEPMADGDARQRIGIPAGAIAHAIRYTHETT